MNDIPKGFGELGAMDAVMSAVAPVFARRQDDGGLILGLRVGPQHCNPRGVCHGGTWATLADVLMGVNVGLITGMSGPTVSMALNFVGAATRGQWVEGNARVLRGTPRLGFADCLFTAEGEPAVRANAVFRRKFETNHDFNILLRQA